MTQEAKIIGIVKKLQEMKSDALASAACGDENAGRKTRIFTERLRDNFPSIAQALLLAVEALEKIKEKEYSSDEDDLNCVAHRCCCGAITYKSHHSDCEVMNALSKISSL